MNPSRSLVRIGLLLAATSPVATRADDTPATLSMSRPVVCLKIHGYGSFEVLPGASLTSDDKLLIYSEPSGQVIEKAKGGGYRSRLAEDVRLRKRGGKEILWKKDGVLEYEPKSPTPPYQVYLRTDLSIKGLPPGEYEVELILHDRLGAEGTTSRVVPFTVVTPPPPTAVKPAGRGDTPGK